MNKVSFKKELEQLINKYSMENTSNTPDFILAEYLWGCLLNYEDIINRRNSWYSDIRDSITNVPADINTKPKTPNEVFKAIKRNLDNE